MRAWTAEMGSEKKFYPQTSLRGRPLMMSKFEARMDLRNSDILGHEEVRGQEN